MKATVVPNRNAIFASILYGYALSISLKEDVNVDIALECILVTMQFILIAGQNSMNQ